MNNISKPQNLISSQVLSAVCTDEM